MTTSPLQELLEIVRRELGASDVRLLAGDEGEALLTLVPKGPEVNLRWSFPDGRALVVTFDSAPSDLEAKRRRVEMIMEDSFGSVLDGTRERGAVSRPPPARSLHDELAALATRSGALDALVIDAHSPVVWGAAWANTAEPIEDPTLVQPPDNVHRIDELPGSPKPSASEVSQRARSLGLRGLDALALDPRAVALVPRDICEAHTLVPLFGDTQRLVVAMANPTDLNAIEAVAHTTGLLIEPAIASEQLIRFALRWNDEANRASSVGDATTGSAPRFASPTSEDRAARELHAKGERDRWRRHFASRRAVETIRVLPEMSSLHKGGHLAHSESAEDFGVNARSFAAIYVLILVFEGAFDEVRAKRAVAHALPTIERLVAALPPIEPPPNVAGAMSAVAVRRRPRR